jgi:hypothetical protein
VAKNCTVKIAWTKLHGQNFARTKICTLRP